MGIENKTYIFDGTEYTYDEIIKILPKPLIHKVGYKRPYKGAPSVTQLLRGEMELVLRELYDDVIPVDIGKRTKALFGDVAHALLESEFGISEARLELYNDGKFITTGAIDYIDIDESGHVTIWDYKTSGSYFVKKWFGWRSEPEPVLDEDGNEVLLKSGKNKGKVKTHNVLKQHEPLWSDRRDYTLQLNIYRYMLEVYLNGGKTERVTFPSNADSFEELNSKLFNMRRKWDGKAPTMKIMFAPRDGGFKAVTNHDMTKEIYISEIEEMAVSDFIYMYSISRKKTLEELRIPEHGCDYFESHNGRKCELFCDVAHICQHHFIGDENE